MYNYTFFKVFFDSFKTLRKYELELNHRKCRNTKMAWKCLKDLFIQYLPIILLYFHYFCLACKNNIFLSHLTIHKQFCVQKIHIFCLCCYTYIIIRNIE